MRSCHGWALSRTGLRIRTGRRSGRGAAHYTGTVFTAEFLARAEFWAYRLGVFVILNVLDDPAWLALIFC